MGVTAPARAQRQNTKAIRRQELIEATIDQLAKRGFEGTTLADVATAAGMSRGIVNFHFDTKEKLLVETLRTLSDEYRGHWKAALKAAGADVVQIDEPHMQAHPIEAGKYAVAAINRALDGIAGPTVVHMCFGYAYVVADKPSGYSFLSQLSDCNATAISIEAAQPNLDPSILEQLPGKDVLFGVINLGTEEVETPELVAERLRGALRHISPERLVAAPDCGMKYLPREVAFGKLRSLAEGAAIVRRELGQG